MQRAHRSAHLRIWMLLAVLLPLVLLLALAVHQPVGDGAPAVQLEAPAPAGALTHPATPVDRAEPLAEAAP